MLNSAYAGAIKPQYTEKVKNPYTGKIETVKQDRPFEEKDFDEIFALFDQEHNERLKAPKKAKPTQKQLQDEAIMKRFEGAKYPGYNDNKSPAEIEFAANKGKKQKPMSYQDRLALAKANSNTLAGNTPKEREILQKDEDEYLKPVKQFSKKLTPHIGEALMNPPGAPIGKLLDKVNPNAGKFAKELAGSAGNPIEGAIQVASFDPIALAGAALGFHGSKDALVRVVKKLSPKSQMAIQGLKQGEQLALPIRKELEDALTKSGAKLKGFTPDGKPNVQIASAQTPTAKGEPKPKAVTPEAKPTPKQVPEQTDVTAARNATQDVKREAMGLDELGEAEHKSFLESLDKANKSGEKNRTLNKATALLDEKNPRAWNDEESAGAILAQRELENEYTDLVKKIEADENDLVSAARLEAVQAEYDTISQALNKSGTAAARALSIRRLGLQPNYNPVVIKARIKALTGKDVDAKTARRIDDLTKELNKANESIAKLENEANQAGAVEAVKHNSTRAPRFSREELDAELDELLKAGRAKMGQASSGLDPELIVIAGKIGLNYAKRGINTLDEVVANTIQYVKEHLGADITKEDVIKGMNGEPRTKPQIDEELKKARQNLANMKRDAKSYAETQKKIADYETRIKTGDYSDFPKKGKRDTGKLLEQEQNRAHNLKKYIDREIARRKPKTAGEIISNVWNAPKSAVSSVDNSAIGRQGLILGLANPKRAVKAFGQGAKALYNEDLAAGLDRTLRNSENFKNGTYKKMKLYLADMNDSPLAKEEAYATNLWGGWTKLNPFRRSEAGFNATLNSQRTQQADAMLDWLGPDASDDAKEVIANYINVATGRGATGDSRAVEGALSLLNAPLFSSRLLLSRIQFITGQPLFAGLLRGQIKGTGKARLAIAKEYAKFWSMAAAVYGVAKGAGAEINLENPDSSDFGKIRIGDTRIDFMAGLLQPMVHAYRLGAGQKRSIGATESKPFDYKDAMSEVGRFWRTKLSPSAGLIVDYKLGSDAVGKQIDPKTHWLNLAPLTPREIVEGLMENGYSEADAIGLLNIFGIGVSTYKVEPKESKKG